MSDELGLDLDRLLRQRGWLRALARRLVSEGDVDDLLQESWLAALRARNGARSSLRAWFAGLARNAARGVRRGVRAEMDWEALADVRPEASELLALAELQERLIASVRALREPYRSTVLLRYFDELSLEEVGRRMGVPGSTARTRLSRALGELRERLDRGRGDAAPALLLELARGGATWIPSRVLEVTLMGTLVKLGAGAALATVLALVLWSREGGEDGREPMPGAEARVLPLVAARLPEGSDTATPRGSEVSQPAPFAGEPDSARAPVAAAAEAPDRRSTRAVFELRLDTVAETFLTEEPDVAGLLDVSAELAEASRVAPGSIAVDQESGRITGALELGESLTGRFSIDGSSFEIELDATSSREPFCLRTLDLRFSDDGGVASGTQATLQFHPNTNESASKSLGDEERLAGWGLSLDPVTGTSAHPITMKAEGRSWILGRDGVLQPRELPWIRNGYSFGRWLELLRPLRQR